MKKADTRKLVLHIGLRKTGSSALQEIFAKEEQFLLQHNIAYPKRLSDFPAHQELALSLEDPTPSYWDNPISKEAVYDHYCKVIEDNIATECTTLLSSEDLSLLTLNFSALSYIKSRLETYEPLIVFYQRDPIDYLISNYKHAVFEGREVRNFSEFVFNIDVLIFTQTAVYWDIWRSVFGAENVLRLEYSQENFIKKSIYNNFMESVFGIEVPDEYISYSSNVGLSNDVISFLLAMNRSNLEDEKLRRIKDEIRKFPVFLSDNKTFLNNCLTQWEVECLKKLLYEK